MLTHIGTETIETERLTLRRFEYSDGEAMLRDTLINAKQSFRRFEKCTSLRL